MAFKGYYIKIGDVEFNSPSPKRDTFKVAPALVQVGKSEVLASGYLSTKVLPHDRRKLWCDFPVMTKEQFRTYWRALHSDAGGHGMQLTVEYYDETLDDYVTDTFYHNDLMYKPITYGGQEMIIIEAFELIGW